MVSEPGTAALALDIAACSGRLLCPTIDSALLGETFPTALDRGLLSAVNKRSILSAAFHLRAAVPASCCSFERSVFFRGPWKWPRRVRRRRSSDVASSGLFLPVDSTHCVQALSMRCDKQTPYWGVNRFLRLHTEGHASGGNRKRDKCSASCRSIGCCSQEKKRYLRFMRQ